VSGKTPLEQARHIVSIAQHETKHEQTRHDTKVWMEGQVADKDEYDGRIEALEDELEQAIGDLAETKALAADLQSRLDAVCKEFGHAERVPGDWPEDAVCPRCGDVEVSAGITGEIVPPLEPGPAGDDERSSFWEFTARAKAEVDKWPAWKRDAAAAAFITEHVSEAMVDRLLRDDVEPTP
jgi:hypothetical protein